MLRQTLFIGLMLLAAPAWSAADHVYRFAPAAADVETPELGRRGDYLVGTATATLALGERLQIEGSVTTKAPRSLSLRYWYPAAASAAPRAHYYYNMKFPAGDTLRVEGEGEARSDAGPLQAGPFPLVVISHGFGGKNVHFTRLAEHLASRGYVVVAPDHRDRDFDTVPTFLASFANVMLDRSLDQQQLLARLLADPPKAGSPMAVADRKRVGLIGYSMGGYGALATAGAAYAPSSPAFAALPAAARAQLGTAPSAAAARAIGAVVLVAPWGGQPDSRVWNETALAKVSAPVLLIGGDQDQVVDYRGGIRWLFDNLRSVQRYLLVYREAQHNIFGDPVSLPPDALPDAVGYLTDPVWRSDRINAVNEHFITAFLDGQLKARPASSAYINTPTVSGAEARWVAAFGAPDTGQAAGDDQPGYWRGFQRSRASGLEMHRKDKDQ